MKKQLYKFIILLFLLPCMMLTACSNGVDPQGLGEEDFDMISDYCRKLTNLKQADFPRYGQFFFKNGKDYASSEYKLDSINLIRRVYSYEDKNGDKCLALPFEATILCEREEGVALLWNFVVLKNPMWVDDKLDAERVELWNNHFTVFYVLEYYNNVQEAIEDEFLFTHREATVYDYLADS